MAFNNTTLNVEFDINSFSSSLRTSSSSSDEFDITLFSSSLRTSSSSSDEFDITLFFSSLRTSSSSSDEFDIIRNRWVAAFVISLYVIVIVLGSVGSVLVILSIARSRLMWTATNVFIANLALSDLFVCVFDLPIMLHYQLTDYWAFGVALCHVIPTSFAVIVFSSAMNLAMIAIDRYVLIVCPLRRKMTVGVAVGTVIAIAVTATCASLPLALLAEQVRVEDVEFGIDRSYCTESWPSVEGRQLYTVLAFIGQFVVPLVVIAVLYYRIFDRLRSRPTGGARAANSGKATGISAATRPLETTVNAEGPTGVSSSVARRSRDRRRARTNTMLVAVVVVFAAAWTPFHAVDILLEFRRDLIPGRFIKFVSLLCRVLAFSSACVNPFLYGWMNENYRTSFLTLFAPLLPTRRSAPTTAALASVAATRGDVDCAVTRRPRLGPTAARPTPTVAMVILEQADVELMDMEKPCGNAEDTVQKVSNGVNFSEQTGSLTKQTIAQCIDETAVLAEAEPVDETIRLLKFYDDDVHYNPDEHPYQNSDPKDEPDIQG